MTAKMVALAMAAVLWAVTASAEPAIALQSAGDPANRFDVVVVGDGYTAAELGKYANDVTTFLSLLFAQQPWAEYRPVMNVYRVDVTSAQSGASHPESGTFKTTALGASYNCGGIQRLICVDVGAVNTVVARSLSASQHDLVFVLVNDTAFGGSGGAVSVASLHQQSAELALHEVGHTLGLLGDEYTEQPPACSTVEPSNANVTAQTARAAIKWNAWIGDTTPLPTTTTAAAVPGLYVGAKYCPSGLFRPTFNSKMRSLGFPYEQINTEQMIKRFYNFFRPLDSYLPATDRVDIPSNGSVTFEVAARALATHGHTVTWLFDGAAVASGAALPVPASALPSGTHTLTAVIRDATPMVRSDPSGVLQTTQSWTISGGSAAGHVPPASPASLSASASGSTVTLTWTPAAPGSAPTTDYVIEAGSAPGLSDLANFSTGNPTTVFSASGVGAGRYYVRVRAVNSAGRSAPSPETLLVVGAACGGAPVLTTQVSGSTVTLTWTASSGAASYVLEAGSAAGRSDLVNSNTGNAQTTFVATGVGRGSYFVRIRAVNACGATAPSNEAVVTVP